MTLKEAKAEIESLEAVIASYRRMLKDADATAKEYGRMAVELEKDRNYWKELYEISQRPLPDQWMEWM